MLVLQSRGQLTNFDRNWALTNIEWGGGGMCQQFCPGLSEFYSRNNSHSAGTIERKHISVTFPWANESHTLKVPREKQVFEAQLFVAFTVGVAVLLPQFSLIIALVGSITAVCFTLVFPCLFDVVLHSDNITTRRYVINVLIIFVGVLSSGFGFVFSIIAIIRVYL